MVNFEEGAEYSIADGDGENAAVYEIEQRTGTVLIGVVPHPNLLSRHSGGDGIVELTSACGMSASRRRPWCGR